jgi:energy-converting hydrogenase Eha subunit C
VPLGSRTPHQLVDAEVEDGTPGVRTEAAGVKLTRDALLQVTMGSLYTVGLRMSNAADGVLDLAKAKTVRKLREVLGTLVGMHPPKR